MSGDYPMSATAKVWSSCIRDTVGTGCFGCAQVNFEPADGDLVAFRAGSDDGLYQSIEDRNGRDVRIYSGDLCVGVLGTRKSGTNANGAVPRHALRAGDTLQLISAAGIVGEATSSPGNRETRLMDVKVEAFLTDQDGHQASIRSIRPINEPLAESEATLVVVGGTSAEVGKTTFICRAIRAIRKHSGATAIAGLKAVGTGRLRDILSYKDAGAANVVDFVSMGWPTTYNVPVAEYRRLFERMLIRGSTGNKFVFIEIGGDLLTEAAGVVLDEAGRRSAIGILCANDAMGAMTGLRLFAEASVPVSIISTFRQNQQAMAERLGWTSVVNAFDQEAMAEVATILTKPASHRRLRPN